MRQRLIKWVIFAAVFALSTVIVADVLKDSSAAKRADKLIHEYRQAVKKADAGYLAKLRKIERTCKLRRYNTIRPACAKAVFRLEKTIANARRKGSDAVAVTASNSVDSIKTYLERTKDDVPALTKTKRKTSLGTRILKTAGGRSKFGGKTYLAVLKKADWDEAKKMARALGGRLASVKSASEMLFLQKLTNRHSAWVGGVLEDGSTTWRWLDGKKISPRLWADKVPESSHRQVVHMGGNGLHHGSPDGDREMFICQWGR